MHSWKNAILISGSFPNSHKIHLFKNVSMKAIMTWTVAMMIYASFAQNTPPALGSVSSPDISGGYTPNAVYNLVISFNENSGRRSFRLGISNAANPGIIGAVSQLPASVDTALENGILYMLSDTGTAAAWNFKWTAPSSSAETINFELVGSAEDLGGGQSDVVHTCNYRVTNSTFGLAGNCTKSSQVGTGDNKSNLINMKICPNPSSGRVMIAYFLHDSDNTQVELLDLSGKILNEIFSGTEHPGLCKHEAVIEYLVPGLYIVKVTAGHQSFFKKISVR
jgi:hypothetical protein